MKKIVSLLAVAFLTIATAAAQQTKKVTGTVKDAATKQPLPGATVMVSGTYRGTTADAKGQFSIAVKEGDKSLDVSFIGYDTKTVNIEKATNVEVLLSLSSTQIKMVEIGYAAKPKANLLGAVSTASVDDANMRALTNADMLLQGKVAGIMMTQNSGQPGNDAMNIRIRGVTSIDDNNTPLVIIDGVPGDINSINPKDIESISVLKDASSAAIYGVEAAAGVIIITSKTGKKGLKINYSNSFSLQQATRLPDVVEDPVLYIDIANEAFLNSGLNPKYTEATREQWAAGELLTRQPEDWKNIVYRNGFMQDHHVILSGAGDRYDYAVSAGYKDQKGVVYSTEASFFDYRTKVNVYFWDRKFRLGANISGRDQKTHEAQSANTIISRYTSNRPILFVKSLTADRNIYSAGAAFCAIEELGGGNDKDFNELSTAFSAELKPFKGMRITSNYNITTGRTRTTKYIPSYEVASNPEVEVGTTKRSELTERSDYSRRMMFNVIANYRKKLGGHNIDLMAGFEAKESEANWHQVHGYDLSKNQPLVSYLSPSTVSVSSAAYEQATLSVFGRISYDYKGRYLFEGNFRRDGSSVFGPGYRYHNSPSAAVAWRISEESFLKNVQWIDNLKLRGSYGILGNYRVSNNYYTNYDRLTPQEYYSFGGVQVDGVGITMLANPFTTWERIAQTNIGVDFDFLREFTFTFEWFNKETTDMLSKVYQPLSLGIRTNSPAVNAGSMRNRGFEISAGYSHRFNKDFAVSVSANVGYVKNTVLSLGGNREQWETTDGRIHSEVGYPLKSIYGYLQTGFYQVDDFTWQNNSDPGIPHMERQYQLKPDRISTQLHSNPRPGDLLLYDKDGDGVITTNDVVRLGKGRSDVQYSFNVDITYKGFNLSILGQGQGKANVYLQRWAPYTTAFTGQIFTSFLKERWTENSTQYRCLFADKQRADIISSYDMHNAAFLRIKNIQLSYTFKNRFLDKLKINGLSVFVSGENLFTFTSFPKDFDPERAVDNNTVNAYPLIKSYSAGIVLNF